MATSLIFIFSEQKDMQLLEETARGYYPVVFVCVEMLEGPSFAKILHSKSFQNRLLGIYVDEAHLIHESTDWRPAYARLLLLRTLIGCNILMIAMSATLPSSYHESLHTYAGFKRDYVLINLGNHRPELSTVIIPMQNNTSSFRDIAFLLPFGIQASDLEPTIIYSDDLDVLTAMFWWARSRLASLGLPVELVDILHAGLTSYHQTKSLSDFRKGTVAFLLASEKIGVGMNFSNVRKVVQYLCRGLTLVRWEQRRG
jgi:superfamily II DNA helicase RecQ